MRTPVTKMIVSKGKEHVIFCLLSKRTHIFPYVFTNYNLLMYIKYFQKLLEGHNYRVLNKEIKDMSKSQ